MHTLLFDFIYLDLFDAISIVVSVAVVLAFLLPVFQGGQQTLTSREWISVRLAIALPFVILCGVGIIGARGFAIFRLIYHVGATVYPLIGALLYLIMWRRERPDAELTAKGRANIAFGTLLLALFPLAIWGTLVEPRWLDVTTTEVTTDAPANVDPIRVVVLADVQTDRFSEWEERVVEETNALNPDIIVIPGDLMQPFAVDYPVQIEKARTFLRSLRARHGVFIVQGDADANVKDYEADATVLFNRIERLTIRGRWVAIGGAENNYHLGGSERTIQAVGESDAELRIVIAHRPYTVTRSPDAQVDLVIAGHSHGGQIVVPFVGPPITASQVDRDVAAGGLSEVDGRKIFVSRGIGLERNFAPRVRLNCRPELALLLIR